MTDEFRAGQGTIAPTLIVGLGGVGSDIVDRLAGRAATLPNWQSQLRPLTSFVTIDTNELDQHYLRHVPEGNRLNIAAFDKARVIEHFRRSRNQQALQWLDRGYQPRPGFKPGAGQIRVESRLSFFYHSPEIRQRLRSLVRETLRPGVVWRQANPPKYNVYLFSTLAGGTGSGCFLSAAYLLDAVIREQEWQPRVVANLVLSTLMQDKVGPELHPDIHANTYAALKELEHLTKLDYPQVKSEGRTSERFVYCRDESSQEILEVRARPFFLSFLFDRPPHLALAEAKHAIADAAFLQIFTPIIDKLASELDNYEKHLESLTTFPGDLKDVGQGYTKNFGAFGAAALVLPGRDLLEYCALRFAAQAIRTQITFGVDPRDPTDDRARALARLAIHYSDPKFLNLADAEREREINRAFVASVQEMARQDLVDELAGGFWHQLVEGIDEGTVTGTDGAGNPTRGEALLAVVARRLDEARRPLLNKVSIKERAFAFHKENVNQYNELVSRLKEDVRRVRTIVDEGSSGLVASAEDGEVITQLKLDPIAERYLALRLLARLETEELPKAEEALATESALEVSSPTVLKRLDQLYQGLQDTARERRFVRRDEPFLTARAEAEDYYGRVARAATRIFDAELRLRQLRALADYLRRRARQYARLANRMNVLVQDLEADAERLRRGEVSIELPLALRVEVFRTLDEPRQRFWDRVYSALFVDDGRYLATFDRQRLAACIAQELRPLTGADGRLVEKSVDQTVSDLRRALCELGRARMEPSILGDAEVHGLDLESGLALEARLALAPSKRPGDLPSEEEIWEYREKKLHALAQLAGVLARVSSADAKALEDGVRVNRTRQLIVGHSAGRGETLVGGFAARLKAVLSVGGRQVKEVSWHDPRLAIVHDVELPIPLYYFQPVVGEIEEAYLKIAAEERRGYHLHTDFNWEKSLPNLNPRRSEITVGWSLQMLAEGLVSSAITFRDGLWMWLIDGDQKAEALGPTLSSALYRMAEIHRLEELQHAFERQVRQATDALPPGAPEQRRHDLAQRFESLVRDMTRRELNGDMSREDILDRPILRALLRQLAARGATVGERGPGPRYGELAGGRP